MGTPKRPSYKDFLRDRSGAVLFYVTLSMPVMLGLVAFAADFGMAYWTSNRLQITADASALAGAALLPVDADVTSEAKAFAADNYPDVDGTTVLAEADIVTGHWDGATFTPMASAGGLAKNAVQTVTRRTEATGNPLPTTFARIFGFDFFDISRAAVAEMRPHDCFIEGLIAEGKIEIGSANNMTGVCAHGQAGAKVGSDNIFTNAELSMRNLGDLEQGGNNTNLDESLSERDLSPTDALNIDQILSDIANGSGPWPDYLDGTWTVSETLPSDPVQGKLYIVNSDVTLSGTVSGYGVYSTKKITISSDATVESMLLASQENIEAGSSISFGGPNYCVDGTGAVFIAAKDQVKMGSNDSYNGVQIIAGNYVDMGSNLTNVAGLAVQSGGDIKMGSTEVSDCDNNNHALFGGGTKVLRLVQ